MQYRTRVMASIFLFLMLLHPIHAIALSASNQIAWNTMSHNMAAQAMSQLDTWDPQSGIECVLYGWNGTYEVEQCEALWIFTFAVKVYAWITNYQQTTTWTAFDADYYTAYVSASAVNPHSGYWQIRSDHFLQVTIDECWWDPNYGWACVMTSQNDGLYANLDRQETVPCMAKNTQPEWDERAAQVALYLPNNRPWEDAVTIECIGMAPHTWVYRYWNDSFAEDFPTGGSTNDPCKSDTHASTYRTAGLHTHPYFTTPSQYMRGNGCFDASVKGEPTPSASQITALNSANVNFSDNIVDGVPVGDIPAFKCLQAPLYLRTPTGSTVKKLQGTPTSCAYSISVVAP